MGSFRLTIFSRGRLRLVFAGVVAVAVMGVVLARQSLFPETHDMSVATGLEARVFGDRVMVVLEAHSNPWRLPDDIKTVRNVRGYLVTARLADANDIGATRHVIGPVYTVDQPVMGDADESSPLYSEKDHEGVTRKFSLHFRAPGSLVKTSLLDNRANLEDAELRIQDKIARWSVLDKHPKPPLLGFYSGKYFESESHRYAVQRETDGAVRIYDKWTGKQVNDRWLEKVCGDYLSNDDLDNTDERLTDDLNFLVLFIRDARRVRQVNGREIVIEDFTFERQKLPRKNHFLVYKRPSERPRLYDGDGFRTIPMSSDGRLLLLKQSDRSLKIEDLEKRTIYSHELAADENWIAMSHKSEDYRDQIVFIKGPLSINDLKPPYKGPNDELIRVARWNYRKDKMSQWVIPLADLFVEKSDGYYPKAAIAVEK